MMLDLIAAFIFGFAGSGHCLGMCGPLVLAYSLHLRGPHPAGRKAVWPAGAARHAAFHTGRLITYGLLGAAAAALAGSGALPRSFLSFRSTAAACGGIAMIILGVCLSGMLPLRAGGLSVFPGPFGQKAFGRLFSSKGLMAKLGLGLTCGCLPCMLSLAMIVKAATTGRPALGFLIMLSFGLGTMPALFFAGLSASLLSLRARILGRRTAAGMLIVMGLILVFRGLRAKGWI